MTPDLSYYWEAAREWCQDSKWDEEKECCTGMLLLHTQHPYPFPFFFFLCVHSSIDRLRIFGAVVVHPERRN